MPFFFPDTRRHDIFADVVSYSVQGSHSDSDKIRHHLLIGAGLMRKLGWAEGVRVVVGFGEWGSDEFGWVRVQRSDSPKCSIAMRVGNSTRGSGKFQFTAPVPWIAQARRGAEHCEEALAASDGSYIDVKLPRWALVPSVERIDEMLLDPKRSTEAGPVDAEYAGIVEAGAPISVPAPTSVAEIAEIVAEAVQAQAADPQPIVVDEPQSDGEIIAGEILPGDAAAEADGIGDDAIAKMPEAAPAPIPADPDPHPQQTTAEMRRSAVLVLIAKAVDDGQICPSNAELASALGTSISNIVYSIQGLERAGLIKVLRFASGRRVDVQGRGRTKLPASTTPHFRAREIEARPEPAGQQTKRCALVRCGALVAREPNESDFAWGKRNHCSRDHRKEAEEITAGAAAALSVAEIMAEIRKLGAAPVNKVAGNFFVGSDGPFTPPQLCEIMNDMRAKAGLPRARLDA